MCESEDQLASRNDLGDESLTDQRKMAGRACIEMSSRIGILKRVPGGVRSFGLMACIVQ